METMKFLMITTHYPPYHIGGDAIMVQNLSEELTARGHEVHIASCPDVFDIVRKGDKRGRMDSRPENPSPIIHQLHSSHPLITALRSHVLGSWQKMHGEISDLQSSMKPDVIHWHNTRAFIGTPFPFADATNIYTAHDFHLVCPKSSLLRPPCSICTNPSFCQFCLLKSGKLPQLWRVGERREIRIPPTILMISPSEFLARILESTNATVKRVIPNFVPDPGKLHSMNLETRNSIVFLGILEPHKGPQILLKAFASSSRDQEMTLEIIGDGSMRGKLARMAVEHGIGNRTRLPGRVSRIEIETAMRRARAVVIPSVWYENCPLSAIEALSFGVPIIASDIGGLPEIATVEAGSTRFPAGSVDDLAKELINIQAIGDELDSKMRMARATYESKYSADKHISKYFELLS